MYYSVKVKRGNRVVHTSKRAQTKIIWIKQKEKKTTQPRESKGERKLLKQYELNYGRE